jgi:hypothetical protein
MGIDRIGKGGGVQPPVGPAQGDVGAPRAVDPSRAFRVEPSKAENVARLDPATVTPLDRLRNGEVDLHGYLDMKVHEATAHLTGLPEGDLGAIRKMLRDQLATDPILADLVERATGRPPVPPEDE